MTGVRYWKIQLGRIAPAVGQSVLCSSLCERPRPAKEAANLFLALDAALLRIMLMLNTCNKRESRK